MVKKKEGLPNSGTIYIYICTVGIQIRKSKIDLNMEALSIGCRNKH